MTTVAEAVSILQTFPPDLDIITLVDPLAPKDDLSFDNYEYEPEILYISR